MRKNKNQLIKELETINTSESNNMAEVLKMTNMQFKLRIWAEEIIERKGSLDFS